ncbi:18201_t:CDS:1, partial [Gigaspora margarita]
KSVTIEEETISPSNSDAEPTPKGGQINFETSFSWLSLEVLKFLCYELGISDIGSKQDLINRLSSECKKKDESVFGLLDKGKSAYAEKDVGDTGAFFLARDSGYIARSRSSNKAFDTDNFGPGIDGCNQFSQGSGVRDRAFFNWDSEDMGIWRKRDLSKARNQWEFNEWCRAEMLIDRALKTEDVEYLLLARQVALERVYVVRVADEDGWNVVTKMASNDLIDPMSQLFE